MPPSSPAPPDGPQITLLGKFVVLLFVVGCIAGGAYLLRSRAAGARPGDAAAPAAVSPSVAAGPAVELRIAYGTEKERWLKWAVGEFAQSKEGANVRIELLPYGSLEGAQAALSADKGINVWTHASSLYKETFALDWQARHNGQAVVREAPLALTPMVFVLWAERFEAFAKKYPEMGFKTIGQALAEPGWKSIANRPEWGLFKFGHTHPNESNSGLMTLTLLAYEFTGKDRALGLEDIQDPAFQKWMTDFERGVNGLSNSTGNMMKEMVLKGPSSFDGLCVYENVAIDYLRQAEGRWGELRVAYPPHNLWNDNPYYILNAPWSSPAQRHAAGLFLDFLLSTRVQQEALVHGFRPANTDVAVRFPESPFVKNARYGVRVDPPVQAETPRAEVLNNLLAVWQRTRGAR